MEYEYTPVTAQRREKPMKTTINYHKLPLEKASTWQICKHLYRRFEGEILYGIACTLLVYIAFDKIGVL